MYLCVYVCLKLCFLYIYKILVFLEIGKLLVFHFKRDIHLEMYIFFPYFFRSARFPYYYRRPECFMEDRKIKNLLSVKYVNIRSITHRYITQNHRKLFLRVFLDINELMTNSISKKYKRYIQKLVH